MILFWFYIHNIGVDFSFWKGPYFHIKQLQLKYSSQEEISIEYFRNLSRGDHESCFAHIHSNQFKEEQTEGTVD